MNFSRYLFVITVLSITLLNAQIVGKIESLTNDELRFNYDVFRGPISSYENKLIVNNGAKTEEFIMHPSGDLEKISIFDYSSVSGMIYGDRYYLPKHVSSLQVIGFYVFDLTKTPMELITFVDLQRHGIQSVSRNTLFFTESHVMASDFEEVAPIVKTGLLGNFPNPFNPETTIRFNVAVESMVSIDIYNIRGQKVKRLFDGFADRGSHTVVWNGKDDNGSELGSGVYFYRMVAGEVVETRRMVLLK
ncbi:MAG: T9SS type A sorting domain-containing protein [Candidatus Cloacimonetes bacterium]|nr:T9SS type A sorting domain-containing protein [Candidatus Cloacimonadota bacterium]